MFIHYILITLHANVSRCYCLYTTVGAVVCHFTNAIIMSLSLPHYWLCSINVCLCTVSSVIHYVVLALVPAISSLHFNSVTLCTCTYELLTLAVVLVPVPVLIHLFLWQLVHVHLFVTSNILRRNKLLNIPLKNHGL